MISSYLPVKISFRPRLDYVEHQRVRQLLSEIPDKEKAFTLDFSNVTYMDSAGISLLLWVRDKAQNESSISLENLNDFHKLMLRMSSFDRFFSIPECKSNIH